MAFAIRLNRRRFVGTNTPPVIPHVGWRPLRWVADPELAEIFSSEQTARTFADHNLSHDDFEVVALVPRRPGGTPPSPGTPIAVGASA